MPGVSDTGNRGIMSSGQYSIKGKACCPSVYHLHEQTQIYKKERIEEESAVIVCVCVVGRIFMERKKDSF